MTVKIQEKCLTATSRTLSISVWHQRLGHSNHQNILKMFKLNVTNGLNLENNNLPSSPCHGCILGKMQRSHFPNTGTRATNIGDLIHTDVCGPMETMSLGKARYFVLFKDDFSGWCEVKFLQNKSEVFHHFQLFTAALQTQHKCIFRTLRSDNGGEYVGKDFEEWLAQKGNKPDSHKTNIIFF